GRSTEETIKFQCSTQINKPVVTAKMPFRGKVTGGKCYVWCACGHRKKQYSGLKFLTLMLCPCKQTKNVPYCDGTHFKAFMFCHCP
uniref:Uncharacterized protein n=1 Tax=Oncorhynchus kisutch TaxID=8019 RepID=A0A8C7CLZ5_ONCKI